MWEAFLMYCESRNEDLWYVTKGTEDRIHGPYNYYSEACEKADELNGEEK